MKTVMDEPRRNYEKDFLLALPTEQIRNQYLNLFNW